MLGLCSGLSWTHSRPTWIHLNISDGISVGGLSNKSSISSIALSSVQSLHPCNGHRNDNICHIVWWHYQGVIVQIVKRYLSLRLTCPRRFRWWSGCENPLFFLPLITSNTITPKLKTSDLSENDPWTAYSGGIYPLQSNLEVRKDKFNRFKQKQLKEA